MAARKKKRRTSGSSKKRKRVVKSKAVVAPKTPLPTLAEVASSSLDFHVPLGLELWTCLRCKKRYHFSPTLPFYVVECTDGTLRYVCMKCYDNSKR